MGDFLFVYGTLRSEFENSHARKLRAEAHLTGRAMARGALFSLGHPSLGQYPGFCPLPEGDVAGELHRLTNPAQTLAALDAYEGEEYTRVRITVRTENSEIYTAWIYQYNGQPPASARIASGDFCKP